MKSLRLVLVFALALCSTSALAWNGRGHMLVAAIAWQHLKPATKDRVTALLKLNPDYATWVKGVPADQQPEVAFVIAATWPDLIKRNRAYKNDGEEPTDPGAAQNIGYSDKLMHKYWHYIDMPFSPDGTTLIDPKNPNAKTQIEAFRTSIESSDTSDDVKSYDLVWLEHLVGDVHQPLHATSRFIKKLPKGDQGGNLICLGKPKPKSTTGKKAKASKCPELHAFWDNLLGVQISRVPDSTNALKVIDIVETDNTYGDDPGAAANDADDADWINESFELARDQAYGAPIGKGPGPFVLTAGYKTKAKGTAKKRVELAGARLANLLNDHLK